MRTQTQAYRGPTADECVQCPECDETHATLHSEVETEIDRMCNRCLAGALVDRMGTQATRYVEEIERGVDG